MVFVCLFVCLYVYVKKRKQVFVIYSVTALTLASEALTYPPSAQLAAASQWFAASGYLAVARPACCPLSAVVTSSEKII